MNYTLQIGRYGQEWDDMPVALDSWDDPRDLTAWIRKGRAQDDFGGLYQFRIIDEAGQVVWHLVAPFEGVRVNQAGDGAQWLEEIRQDYGIDADVWTAACQAWLADRKAANS